MNVLKNLASKAPEISNASFAVHFQGVRHFGHEYRLLVPQLPDFDFSRTSGHFWHSNEERAALVTAFAAALGVSRDYETYTKHSL